MWTSMAKVGYVGACMERGEAVQYQVFNRREWFVTEQVCCTGGLVLSILLLLYCCTTVVCCTSRFGRSLRAGLSKKSMKSLSEITF